jgi:hypothetical protein
MSLHDFIIESARKFEERSGVKPTHVIMSEKLKKQLAEKCLERLGKEDRRRIREKMKTETMQFRGMIVIPINTPRPNVISLCQAERVMASHLLENLEFSDVKLEAIDAILGPYWVDYEMPGGNDG